MLMMRGVLVFLIAALSIECAQLSAASQDLPNRTAVTVQIRDYARVKPKSLAKAKEIATRMYRRAGIGLEWLGDVAQDSRGAHDVPRVEEWRTPAAQLTIDIVTASIANAPRGETTATMTPPSAKPNTWSTCCKMRPIATAERYVGPPSNRSGTIELRAAMYGGLKQLPTKTTPMSTPTDMP